ncbi:sulfatase-like hydrolase/transferase [Halogeometricum borinquense]|uniref:sulfatase-like hydrolase/transferase n=1 Tax=Halogeometricum borinquense TaxID=60847 RepID=UPI0034131C01
MHVVLVTASAVRHDHVHAGDGQIHSSLPTLSRLADDATVFSRAYTSSPDHESTLRAILTGTHPTRDLGVVPTLVDTIAESGWETGLFHGDSDGPLASWGFEVPDESTTHSTTEQFRRMLGQKITAETTLGGLLERGDRLLGSSLGIRLTSSPTHTGEAVTERALSWLTETTEPQFLWVHYDDAAAPHVPREGTVSDGIDKRTATKLAYATENAPETLTDDERETLKTLYRGELEHLDQCLGQLFDGIQSRLDANETVTAFAGTNGCPLGEHGTWYETTSDFHDESVRVPLFIHGPKFDAETVEFAASSVDILPTLLAAVGVKYDQQRGGSDLRTFMGRRVTERQVFAASGNALSEAMVCNSRWKLARALREGRETLFDHGDDPKERRDRSSENLPVHRALSHALDCFVENRRTQQTESSHRITASGER